MPAVTTTKRNLNQHTAQVLAQVTDATDVVVTEHGEPRWRLSAYRAADSALARLERDGRYTPPLPSPTPWPSKPGGPAYTSAEAGEMLDEMKGGH